MTAALRIAMIGLRGLDSGLGGVEKAVREISTRLVKLGADVTCFCRPRYNEKSEYEGVKLINSSTIHTKHGETAVYALLSMLKAARGDYDIIHIHALASSFLSWIPRLIGKEKKIVVTIHGLDWQRAKWGFIASSILKYGERCAVRNADKVICVSMSLQVYFQMRYIGMGSKFVNVPNGCDAPPGRQVPPPDELKNKKYLLYMGRLVPEKGIHRLIEAYWQLDTDCPLIIAGPATHAEDYFKTLRTLAGDDSRIRFIGSISGEEKERYLSNAYIFVLPSEIEGLPIALLEAAGRGVCPLVSSIPTAVEVLGSRQLTRGFVVDSQSVNQLRIVMEVALENPELVQELGQVAKAHVLSHYGWDRIARQTISIYRQLMNKKSEK